jgi:hypothetical protein
MKILEFIFLYSALNLFVHNLSKLSYGITSKNSIHSENNHKNKRMRKKEKKNIISLL